LPEPFTVDALPGRVVFGPGVSLHGLRDEVSRLGATRVLIVVAEHERELAERLGASLGEHLVGMFTHVLPHVPAPVAKEAIAIALRSDADALLSIGGGSTTGTAKAVALETGLPIIAVPTTYAGSEMTPVWGTTTSERKTTGRSPKVLPKVVIYDPELTFSLPADITAPSAMNALAHCVEAFYAPQANPITSLVAEEGLRAIARSVPVAVREPENLDARSDMLYGAYLAGSAFAVAGGALHHKICHVLGGAYDLPHAETHSALLPQVVAFNAPAIPDVMARVARAVDADDAACGLFDLAVLIGSPVSLEDVGLRADALDEAVALVLEQIAPGNPRTVGEDDVRAILTGALLGVRPSPVGVGAL
jgi:alcohol dehydrogenase class IV